MCNCLLFCILSAQVVMCRVTEGSSYVQKDAVLFTSIAVMAMMIAKTSVMKEGVFSVWLKVLLL